MAVTVTSAAPSTSIDRLYAGSYGPSGASKTFDVSHPFANKRVRLVKLTLSSTYVTGGFALTPANYGLSEIHGLAVVCDTNAASGGAAVPRLTTTGASPVVKLYKATNTEFDNAGSTANFVFTVLLIGI